VFGYDSKVTKYTSGATNQNSVHSHSKDLLFALMRERPTGRRLIFVAHSLGGIVVKEVRRFSSPFVKKLLTIILDACDIFGLANA
jgi:predicted alpha/beta hydrolase family esterase